MKVNTALPASPNGNGPGVPPTRRTSLPAPAMVLQAVRAVVENMASSITAIKRFMWDLLAKSDMDGDMDKDVANSTGHCPRRHVTASRREARVENRFPQHVRAAAFSVRQG